MAPARRGRGRPRRRPRTTDGPTASTCASAADCTIERPRLQPVSFDLYRDIHKAIRAELFAVVADAGRLDPADDLGRRDLADQVTGLVSFLQQHARHEDGVLQAPLEQAAPGLAAQVAVEHEAIEARMAHLVTLVDILRQPAAGSARAAVHELYVDLAAFTADYLSHQDREERVVAQVLEQAVGFDGCSACTAPSSPACRPRSTSPGWP